MNIGRGERIRTSDPLHPMQVRYQAALRPEQARNYSRAKMRFDTSCIKQSYLGQLFLQDFNYTLNIVTQPADVKRGYIGLGRRFRRTRYAAGMSKCLI